MAELRYHAFLAHSSADKPVVEELARRLVREGISCWLDKWNLIPGEAWCPALERGLRQSETCLVLIGPSDLGEWAAEEMDFAIRESVERKPRPLRVLPVLLPGGSEAAAADRWGFLKGRTWVRFSQSIDEPEAFRNLVCGIQGGAPGPPVEQRPFVNRCPYVGLRPFRPEESTLFFGREGTIRQLLARLDNWFGTRDEQRFLTVLGPSGSGKSSSVSAGLLPVLQHAGLPESERWLYLSCKPGPDPWESLQVALGSHPEIRPHLRAIADQVAGSCQESAWLHLAGRYALNQPDDPRRLVLFVDQFEEVFTYARRDRSRLPHETTDADGLGPQRRLFIDNLLHAVREEQGRVIVILAMRADFYGHCALLPALRTAVSHNHVLLGPMSRDELRDAIVCPAQRYGLEVEPALVERLLDDVERQSGALPFLQHTLEQLWKAREGHRLTAAAFERMGSIEGAVDRYAEEYLLHLEPDRRQLLQRILLDLVQLGEEEAGDTKRRRALRDLPGGGTEDLHLFIKDLADRNLVTTSQPLDDAIAGKTAGEVEVELSHEALLRGWKSFQRWIRDSREQLRFRDRIEAAARQWGQHARDESYLWRGGQWAGAQVELSTWELELGDESRAFLDACEVLQRRESRRKRRNRYLAMAVMVAVAVSTSLLYIGANEQKRVANERLAETSWLVAQRATGTGFAQNEMSSIKATHYLLRAAGAADSAGDDVGRRNAVLAARNQAANIVSTLLHDGPILGAVDSPDETRILTWSDDGTARLWRADDGGPLGRPMEHDARVSGGRFSADGRKVLTWSQDGTARLWNATDGTPVGDPMKPGKAVNGTGFSPDGKQIVTWSQDNTARVWDARDGTPAGKSMSHEEAILGARFRTDGRQILTWSQDGTARLWNATDGTPVGDPMKHDQAVNGARFSPDEKRILTWSIDHTAHLWNATDGSSVGQVMQHGRAVTGAVFTADGRRILTWSQDGTARLWDARDGTPAGDPMKHGDVVNGAEFSQDERWILTWSQDDTGRLWNATDGTSAREPMKHRGAVHGARFSPDGKWILTWSQDGTARLWQAGDGEPAGSPMQLQHDGVVRGAQFSPDGHWILTWSEDCTARLWDAAHGCAAGWPMRHEAPIDGALFVANGRRILTWSGDGVARLWTVTDDNAVCPPMEHEKGRIEKAWFSTDGKRVLTWDWDCAVQCWDATDGHHLGSLAEPNEEAEIQGAQFSRDGQQVLTWDGHGRVWLWRTADGNIPGRRMKHEGGELQGAQFSRDGRQVLTWDGHGRVWLWRTADGDIPDRPMAHEGAEIRGARFSVDGRRVLAWSWNCVYLWDTTDGKAVGVPIRHDEKKGAEIRGAQFSADGQQILTWGDDSRARRWRVDDGGALGRPMKHDEAIRGAQLSVDGQRILTWSDDATARLWSATDGSPVSRPMRHDKAVIGAQFNEDGRRILTWSEDGTARLWSTGNSQCMILLRHSAAVTAASSNGDETRLLTVSEDGSAHLWDISLDDRVSLEERTLEFEVRSATTLGLDGQVRVLSIRDWNDRRNRLLQMEIERGRALMPSGAIRTLTPNDVAARKRQLDEIRRNRYDRQ